MADLVNDLVWSYSRAKAASGCPRAYWFTYYGSWGGWEARAAPEVRDAYVQKKLTSRAMWIGTVVHGVAESALQRISSGDPPPQLDEAVAAALAAARRDIAGSADGSWLQRPAKRVGFREHYYDEPVSDADWDAALAEIERQVRNLWAHRIFRRLLAVPARIREVEQLRRFQVGDTPVYAALDALVDDGQGGVVIVDWKTGESHEDAEIAAQLGVYGLYATQELGVSPDKILAMHVNTRHGTETRHPVGPAEIEAARSHIATTVAEMRSKLKDVAKNVADREDFPPLELGSERCRWCSVRGVCGRR